MHVAASVLATLARQLLRLAYWSGLRGMLVAILTLFGSVIAALCAAGQHRKLQALPAIVFSN